MGLKLCKFFIIRCIYVYYIDMYVYDINIYIYTPINVYNTHHLYHARNVQTKIGRLGLERLVKREIAGSVAVCQK